MNTTKIMVSKFAGTCKSCNTAMPAGTLIAWSKDAGAKHADGGLCIKARVAAQAAAAAAPAPVVAPAVTLDASPIVAFLQAARLRGLKFPAVRFLAPGGGELRLSLAGAGSKAPGSVQVKVGGEWQGRVEPNGAVVGMRLAGNPALVSAMNRIAAAPALAAAEYGKLTGCCSFCDRALEDAGSVLVGYGPVCAKRYDLPHKPQGTPVLAAA